MKRLFLILLLLCSSSIVRSETIAATGNGVTTTVLKYVYSSKIYSTGAAVCAAMNASNSNYYGFTWATNASYPNGFCQATKNYPFSGWGESVDQAMRCDGPDGSAATGATPCAQIYSCPSGQNWTLSGTTCTRPDCTDGQTRNSSTGICESACGTSGATWNGLNCACPGIQSFNSSDKSCTCETGGRLKGTSIAGSGSTSPSSTCYSGCMASVGGLSIASGGFWAAELGNFTGAKCSGGTGSTPQEIKVKEPTADNRTPEQKCLASGQGYVTTSTGTTCTSAGNSPNPISTKTEENKTIKDQSGAITGIQETKVECVGAQCTTTITTKDANGNVTGTTSTSGTGSGSGTGTGSGNGSGETDCDKHPTAIGCLDAGTPGGNDAVGTSPIGLNSISPVSLGGGGSCPSPVTLPRGQTFSWQPICDFAFGIRPIVLMLAWLAAAYIVLGWGTKDNG